MSISLEEMWEDLKSEDETSRLIIDTADKTIEIIEKITAKRKALGLSRKALAKKCGLKKHYIKKMETLKVIPKLNTLIKIAEAVNIKIEAL